jgi:hypothetical protein
MGGGQVIAVSRAVQEMGRDKLLAKKVISSPMSIMSLIQKSEDLAVFAVKVL